MQILITGGTGFIGSHLVKSLTDDGHSITILTRKAREGSRLVSYREWNGKEMPPALGFYDVIINLAGASIAGGRWSDSYKQLILDSRVDATRACVKYIQESLRKPKLFISGSAIGYYGIDQREWVDETAPPADDFLGKVCLAWEQAAEGAGVRTVFPRTGVVLGKDGGALPQMITPYKFWLGGKFGDGKQAFPWIHIDDMVKAIRFFIEDEDTEGPVNMVAPNAPTQAEFSEKLAHALGVMDLMWVPKFGLRMILGGKSALLWGGQRAKPSKLKEWNYTFKFEDLEKALDDLI
ncbi:MAG: TIGR01777 family oxidoreductase [Bacteroidia bacterium]